MFDLIDEVKQNFYEFLGVSQSATTAEIRQAYRRLSAVLHPDKNPGDPEAGAKFRMLAGIYEVLKDSDMRKQYDNVLVNGLPDWKMPIFYYRKLRKMSNVELFSIFFIMATLVHYAVLWGSVFETRLTLEDQLNTAYKRHKARDRKLEQIDMEIAEKLNEVPKPTWKDILPFAIFKWIYRLIMFVPILVCYSNEQISLGIEQWRQLRREKAETQMVIDKMKTVKTERKRKHAEEYQTVMKLMEQEAGQSSLSVLLSDLPSTDVDADSDVQTANVEVGSKEWSENDITNLVRAVSRFPGGVPDRWRHIAVLLNRPIPEVIAKVKELGDCKLRLMSQKDEEIPVFETNANPICGESASELSDNQSNNSDNPDGLHTIKKRPEKRLYRKKEQATLGNRVVESATECVDTPEENNTPTIVISEEEYVSRKKLKQQKLSLASDSSKNTDSNKILYADGWTQIEQKQLEVAIRSIPKGSLERWDRIADCVPTKSKVEVMARVKYLSSITKQKPRVKA